MRNLFSKYGRVAKPSPQGAGKAFFVGASGATYLPNLTNHFVTDEEGDVRSFTTIADAISAASSGRGDYIYVLPGTYTITTALAMSKADIHLIALGSVGSAILTGSAADIMDITANGCEVAGFQMNLASTQICIDMAGASGCNIHDNVFLSAVGGSGSHFIRMATTACNYNTITKNRFISNLVVAGGAITQTSHITGLGIGNLIEENVFVAGRVTTANTGTVTAGVIFGAAADAGNCVRNNEFTEFNGGIFTAGVNYGTTALGGSVICTRNNFMLATNTNAVVPGSNAASFANNIADGTV